MGIFLYHIGSVNGDLGDLLSALMKYHIPLEGGGRVIDMNHNVFDALDGFKGPLDQMFPALHQHLDPHIVRDHAALHQLAQEVILDLGGSRKTDLNLLEAQLYQHIEEFHLLFHYHRLHKSLIAVPQIYAAPHRGLHDLLKRPAPLRKIHHRHSLISLIIQHILFLLVITFPMLSLFFVSGFRPPSYGLAPSSPGSPDPHMPRKFHGWQPPP